MLQDLSKDMAATSKRKLVDIALSRISDPQGEGSKVFTRVYADAARAAADFADKMTDLGVEVPALAGVAISIKDLFDVKGEPTLAGSRVLANTEPASSDAVVVQRLRQSGAAIIGKTNMTEFAFSGLGINPHYGTPANVWRRAEARIPGGSSSGAAISITDGMAAGAIGTDTGGSVRIPAALNGLVGFKPSAQTVPLTGTLPLSTHLDSIAPLAADVDVCVRLYSVLSGTRRPEAAAIDLRRVTLGAITNYVLDQMDSTVGAAYEKALSRLSAAGVTIRETALPVLGNLPELFPNGGIVAAEAFHWHRDLMEKHGDAYDPRVLVRLQRGKFSSAADYIALLEKRAKLVARWESEIIGLDAVAMPTVPMVAPRIHELEADERYNRVNLLMLRNPTIVNALDGCAISLPCHDREEAPVGLMLASRNGRDWPLLALAKAVELIL